MSNTKITALWFDRQGCGPSEFALRLKPMPAEKDGAIPATLGLQIAHNDAAIPMGDAEMIGGGFMLYRDQVQQLRDALDAWLSSIQPTGKAGAL